MPTYHVTINFATDVSLAEDELFPDGRPSELPHDGPLESRDVAAYLRRELTSFRDLDDWGLSSSYASVFVITPEGDRGFGTLDLRA